MCQQILIADSKLAYLTTDGGNAYAKERAALIDDINDNIRFYFYVSRSEYIIYMHRPN